ncbi:MAG: GatB/YqeY domain-containing protein [Dehalococcoidia bacterium]
MSLQERITSDLHKAQKQGDKSRVSALRLIISGIQYAEIAKGASLDEAGVIDVFNKEVKQRRESIEEFAKGNRGDLVEKEKIELAILLEYLPKQLSREEVTAIVKQVINEVGAKGPGDKGKVMSRLMPQVKGKADGREAGSVVDEILAAL